VINHTTVVNCQQPRTAAAVTSPSFYVEWCHIYGCETQMLLHEWSIWAYAQFVWGSYWQQVKQLYLLGVQFTNDGKDNCTQSNECNVIARANQRREQQAMSRWTKYITVNLLPTILVSKITLLGDTILNYARRGPTSMKRANNKSHERISETTVKG